jgi:hypothetical protein
MPEKAYKVLATAYGNMRNRDVVEKAAMEGRTVPPLVEYLKAGDTVKLDPSAESTKRALKAGSIEEPGASEARQAESLQAQLDALNAQQAALRAQMPSTAADEDKGPSLADLQDEAVALGISKSGKKDEIAARIEEHKATLAASTG